MQLLFCCLKFRSRAWIHLIWGTSAEVAFCFPVLPASYPESANKPMVAFHCLILLRFLASLRTQTLLSQLKISGRQHTPTYRLHLELLHECKLLEVAGLTFCWKVSFLLIYLRFFSRDYMFWLKQKEYCASGLDLYLCMAQNRRMVWVERDVKDHLVPDPLLWAGLLTNN